MSHENIILPNCVQLVFEWTGPPASDEILDSIIVNIVSCLEAKRIMENEPFVDR